MQGDLGTRFERHALAGRRLALKGRLVIQVLEALATVRLLLAVNRRLRDRARSDDAKPG